MSSQLQASRAAQRPKSSARNRAAVDDACKDGLAFVQHRCDTWPLLCISVLKVLKDAHASFTVQFWSPYTVQCSHGAVCVLADHLSFELLLLYFCHMYVLLPAMLSLCFGK